MLIDGRWDGAWHPTKGANESGSFKRWDAAFRNWITPDGVAGPTGVGGFKAEAGRYHLVVAYACPWASRTLIARELKGLTQTIGVSFAQAEWSDEGWRIDDAERDGLAEAGLDVEYVHQIYSRADQTVSGRASVPVLWDKQRRTIVNNESADILRMFNDAFADVVDEGPDLYPVDLRAAIDALNTKVYATLNNGVYRAGFAAEQAAYADAFDDVFATLDRLEARLSEGGPFLFGDRFTEADVRGFVTLVRFDLVYYGLFKCNRRRLVDYPALDAYTRRVLAIPGVAGTVNADHIKRKVKKSVSALHSTDLGINTFITNCKSRHCSTQAMRSSASRLWATRRRDRRRCRLSGSEGSRSNGFGKAVASSAASRASKSLACLWK